MSFRLAWIIFDRHHYDPRGDVLYLDVAGYDGAPAHAYATPKATTSSTTKTGTSSP